MAGKPADKRWDHEQTARELYAVLDRPRNEDAEAFFARGHQALEAGDLAAVQRE